MMRLPLLLLLSAVSPMPGMADQTDRSGEQGHSAQKALHWNRGRGYSPFLMATPDGLLLSNPTDRILTDSITLPIGLNAFRLSFRVDNRHGHPSRKYEFIGEDGRKSTRKLPPWAFFITDDDGRKYWVTVSKEAVDVTDELRETKGVSVSLSADRTAKFTPATHEISEQALPFAGESLWTLDLTRGTLRVIAGASEPTEILREEILFGQSATFGFVASPGGEILVSDISLSSGAPAPRVSPLFNGLTVADTEVHIREIVEQSDDPLEGYWDMFDRTLDESLLKLGGDYRFAVVRNGDVYELIYLAGAVTNRGLWQPGMVKGVLTPTSFPDLFNLKWIDAEGKSLSHSVTAQSSYNGTLTLQFPYHSSTLRLRKAHR